MKRHVRTISYFLSIISAAFIFFGLEFSIEKFLYPDDEAVDIFSAIVGALAFSQYVNFFDRVTHGVFFRFRPDCDPAIETFMNISHELQTPIAILRGNVELLQRRDVDDTDRALAERVVVNTLDSMSRLIGNVLESAKLKFSKNVLYRQNVSMKGLLEETYDDVLLLAKEKEIDLSLVGVKDGMAADDIFIHADRDKLKEVLLNLISNAFKHTGRGGTVVLRTAPAGKGRVFIAVEDSGCGIPAKELPYIFERFYRIRNDPGRSMPLGTGIGLDICRQIIEAHSGKISVESQVGKGSRFIIYLPMVPPSRSAIINS